MELVEKIFAPLPIEIINNPRSYRYPQAVETQKLLHRSFKQLKVARLLQEVIEEEDLVN